MKSWPVKSWPMEIGRSVRRVAVVISFSALAACGGDDSAGIAAAGDGGGTSDATSQDAASDSSAGSSSGDSSASDSAASVGDSASGGSDDASPGDSGNDAGADVFVEAPHPAPPQAVNSGGPVLASPKLVPIFFHNDDPSFVAELTDFTNGLGATDYWAAAGEYGIGPATATSPIMVAQPAPATIDDSSIQSWLVTNITQAGSGWPAPDANTLYVIYYPAGTTVTNEFGGTMSTSCRDFGGYHMETSLNATTRFPYAVIPRCSALGDLLGIDATTGAASHEILEGSTDPFPDTNPAYYSVDSIVWFVVLGGELGDLCAQFPGSFTKFAGFDYTVQRFWSNAQAIAGHDWCVPALPAEVYFNSAPVFPDTPLVPVDGTPFSIPAVDVPLGSSRTIDLELFSDGRTSGPWVVYGETASASGGLLEFSAAPTTGKNGDIVHLTITNQGASAPTPFFVLSTLGTTTQYELGLVVPVAPPDAGTDAGGNDSGSGDSGAASGSDSGSPSLDAGVDAAPTPPIVPANSNESVRPAGFTSDDYLVFYDDVAPDAGVATRSVLAVPSSGGSPTTVLLNRPPAGYVTTSGPDAFYFDGSGALSVWTSSSPLAQVGNSTQFGRAEANAEGDFYYFDNLSGSGFAATKDLYVAKKDGSGVSRLVQAGYDESCYFAPFWAGNGIAAQYCTKEVADGGAFTLPPTLAVFSSLFSGSTGTSFGAVTAVGALSPNPVGATLAVSADGTTLYAPLANGSGALLSEKTLSTLRTFGAGAGVGYFAGPANTTVFFQASDTLSQVTGATSPSPVETTIVTGGVAGLYGLSPNGAYAMYYTAGSHGASDLCLTSTSVAGSAQAVVPAPGEGGAPGASDLASSTGGPNFTADSNYALYATTVSLDPTTSTPLVALAAALLSSAPASTAYALGTNVSQVLVGTGSKVVFCANYAGATGTCDLYSVNLGTAPSPTLLASQVNAGIAVSPDGTRVAFGGTGTPPGLYVISIP